MNALLKELLARGYTIEKEGRYHANATVIRGMAMNLASGFGSPR
jgi:hypothetical protein